MQKKSKIFKDPGGILRPPMPPGWPDIKKLHYIKVIRIQSYRGSILCKNAKYPHPKKVCVDPPIQTLIFLALPQNSKFGSLYFLAPGLRFPKRYVMPL
jgi:hypothetical protein